MGRRIPDLLIEQLHLGELPPRKSKRLLAESDTAERLRALDESDSAILERFPPDRMAALIRERARPESAEGGDPYPLAGGAPSGVAAGFRRMAGRVRLVPLLAAAVLVVGIALVPIILSTGGGSPARSGESSVRVKGILPALRIYRETAGGIELLGDGSRVRRGDLLQIGYIPGAARYGTIFSIDGAGAITLHYPEREDATPLLATGGEVLLPFSYELDAAPRFERFFFVTSSAPFSVRGILETMRRTEIKEGPTALPSLPPSFGLITLTLKKGG